MTQQFKGVIICLVMLSTSWLGYWLQPSQMLADKHPAVELAGLVPEQFGAWHLDRSIPMPQLDPLLKQKTDAAYLQTLARVYVNRDQRRVMLSIAYGSNQFNDRMQAHRPEYCYRAQGFQVNSGNDTHLQTGFGMLAVRQLSATQPGRDEPITYWITIGDNALLPGLQRKLTQLKYGLRGEIPDGMLIRVSSVNPDLRQAYADHESFVHDWMASVKVTERIRLMGKSALT